ncbi:MAG TPA: hypothetical protein VNP98_17185 [Chthoniobacterales bacterium]|nr:hypothetical protein [Chthoniobacterales bacterium]
MKSVTLKQSKEWWQGTDEERMARRAARRAADPEFQARLAARQRAELDRVRTFRYREIWGAIIAHERWLRADQQIKIATAPRIRGCGHAARKAGF